MNWTTMGSDTMSRGLNWNALPKKYREKSGKNLSPYEEKEQMKLAEYLDWKRYCWLHVPIVIELKREEGGRVSESQRKWLEMLRARGWLTKVCEGADEAIDFLEAIFEGV